MRETPRSILHGTRAETLLRRDFYGMYLQARYIPVGDIELKNALEVFTEQGIQHLQQYITETALQASVVLTERLSNRVLAAHLVQNGVERFVVVNTRFRVDPDVLTHALIEEYIHSQLILDGLDVEAQKRQFAYHERAYEQDAKRIATEILGYSPDNYETYLIRDEPVGILYDVSSDSNEA